MPNISETRPDALTELIRILRDQLQQKDERIATLEALLLEASRRLKELERLQARLPLSEPPAASSDPSIAVAEVRESAAPPPAPGFDGAAPVDPSVVPLRIGPPAAPPSEASAPRPDDRRGAAGRARVRSVPQLGPKVDDIASLVFAAAERRPVEHDAAHAAEPAAPRLPVPASVPLVQRVHGAVKSDIAADERATTLRLDREGLHRGHRAVAAQAGSSGWRRLLPWRARRARS